MSGLLSMVRDSEPHEPVELTIDANGVSEETFGKRSKDDRRTIELIAKVTNAFPDFVQRKDFQNWEMIGFTRADGINYFEDTVGVVYRGVPSRDLIAVSDPRSQFLDYYQVKYGLQTSTKVLKVYDSTFGLYALPLLPEGILLHTNQGVGRHFGSEKLENLRDIYFAIHDCSKVQFYCEHFDLRFPTYGDENEWQQNANYKYGYGIAYDEKSLKPVKVKRYFFPHDPSLQDTLVK